MDWNRVEGNWKQVKGKVKEKWGKLTDDDLDVINGRRDQLEGKIQERYGYAKDQVRKDIDDRYYRAKMVTGTAMETKTMIMWVLISAIAVMAWHSHSEGQNRH